jgi:glycerol-3-phosphate dehydrogenase
MVQNLLSEYGRTDADVLALAGPIETDDLVESETVTGIIAGAAPLPEKMADLFLDSEAHPILSTDPIGVQAADILARVYALCVNIMGTCSKGKPGFIRGRLFAKASAEARALTLSMGASPATFTAGSIPWTATFVTLSTEGPLKDLGEKLGTAVKKGKNPARTLNKLSDKWRQNNNSIQVISDMEAALACGEQRGVDLPLLREVYEMIGPDSP